MSGVVNQVAAIQERNDFHSRRENVVVQLLDLGLDRLKRRVRLGALSQQDNSFGHVVVVDNLAIDTVNRLSVPAQPDLRTLRYDRDVSDTKRRSILRLDDSVFNVVDIVDQADGTHIYLLQARFNETAAGIQVIISKLLLYLPDA